MRLFRIAQCNAPSLQGKWRRPKMANPAFKGIWAPRQIDNPAYFDPSDAPLAGLQPVTALGIELWTMSKNIMFGEWGGGTGEISDHWWDRKGDKFKFADARIGASRLSPSIKRDRSQFADV